MAKGPLHDVLKQLWLSWHHLEPEMSLEESKQDC